MQTPPHPPLRIMITAGEVSGDRQAAFLAGRLLERAPDLILYGTGGEMMKRAGVRIDSQTSQYGSVGIQESLRFVRPLRRTLQQITQLLETDRPDLAVLVDNEGFNGMLARHLYRRHIPFVYYFPPQVWLWGEWRARRIARQADLIIPAFKPEAEIYSGEGGNVEWFGHPLLDIVTVRKDPASVLRTLGLNPARRTIGIMPGSRIQEIEQLCDPILGAVRILLKRYPDLQVIMPVAAPHLNEPIESRLLRTGLSRRITTVTEDVYECLRACELLLLSSGTATLEGALIGVPMVAAYRVAPVTFAIGKRVVKSRFIAMPNILLDEPVIPEVIQDEVTADKLASLAFGILGDPQRAEWMRKKLAGVRPLLGTSGVVSGVAGAILEKARQTRTVDEPEIGALV